MEEAIQAIAHAAERAAGLGAGFTLRAFVYYDDGSVAQVLRHEYEGGDGDWYEVLRATIGENLPERNGAAMLRWTIEYGGVAGNHKIGGRSDS